MVAFKNITTIVCVVLSITTGTLGNPVTTKRFKDIVLTPQSSKRDESSKRDGWDGMKAYPWSTDCGNSDGNWEGYTWEGPIEPYVCYRYWQDGQQVDMYSIALSGNWASNCGLGGGSVVGWHNANCDDPVPHPVGLWGLPYGCWNENGLSMKSLWMTCGPAPLKEKSEMAEE